MAQKQPKVWATEEKSSCMAQKEQKRGAAGEKEKQRRNYSEPLPIFIYSKTFITKKEPA